MAHALSIVSQGASFKSKERSSASFIGGSYTTVLLVVNEERVIDMGFKVNI